MRPFLKVETGKEGGPTRIGGQECEEDRAGGGVEQGGWLRRRKGEEEIRNEDTGTQEKTSTARRTENNRAGDDTLSFPKLVQALRQTLRDRGGLPKSNRRRTECFRNSCGYAFVEWKEGSTLALLVARERVMKAVFSTLEPGTSTGETVCGRPMAWHRGIGVAVGDTNVKSDEPVLPTLMESLSNLRAM